MCLHCRRRRTRRIRCGRAPFYLLPRLLSEDEAGFGFVAVKLASWRQAWRDTAHSMAPRKGRASSKSQNDDSSMVVVAVVCCCCCCC